jgi:rhodanese-related sulfurtransferase
VADLAGVRRIALGALQTLEAPGRTVYRFDVRTPEEYAAGHLPGFASAPGGQLVQETDHQVPVRGARIVLTDDDGVRASMSASWLAQMGWEVYVPEVVPMASDFVETSVLPSSYPPIAAVVGELAPKELSALLKQPGTEVIDVTTSANYVKRHIPGAWYAIRAQLAQALDAVIPPAQRYVLTCGSSLLARYAAADLRSLLDAHGKGDVEVLVLTGGNAAWFAAGLDAETGETRLATARTDRYRRPYEGTDAPAEAMQAYLDWEYGLVAQLGRDGTHHFNVI